ncbi:hypothetical protein UK23_41290 [Lentzea aerocolonigenes]|uniref:Uncharacterized protein n=1 Tax=Lentzea aerocolonigenes TaxID=68170 RepID=A0A0F0GDI7_LENAE|nr:hypothetical protein [Lentzea aerocolonigenes]KJK38308.1 hypothetical protein UK23_41290 [Lentzea aerocolonigenes]
MTLNDISLQQQRVTALEKLDNAVCTALTNIELDEARKYLSEALADCAATDTTVPAQVLACVEAADEHLGYSERMEARTLLTVAHRMLARVPRPVLPRPSTPGDVILRG